MKRKRDNKPLRAEEPDAEEPEELSAIFAVFGFAISDEPLEAEPEPDGDDVVFSLKSNGSIITVPAAQSWNYSNNSEYVYMGTRASWRARVADKVVKPLPDEKPRRRRRRKASVMPEPERAALVERILNEPDEPADREPPLPVPETINIPGSPPLQAFTPPVIKSSATWQKFKEWAATRGCTVKIEDWPGFRSKTAKRGQFLFVVLRRENLTPGAIVGYTSNNPDFNPAELEELEQYG